MLDLHQFSRAVAQIYDASLDVTRWPGALSTLAELFGGRGAQISVFSSVDLINFVSVWGWTDEELAGFMPRYIELTPRDPRGPLLAAARFKAMHCREVVSDEVLWASDMYREVLGPVGIEYSMCFSLPIDEDTGCLLSVMRTRDHAPFTRGDCLDFSALAPHVSRAVTMHGVFQQNKEELTTVKAMLDEVPLGMIALDGEDVIVANRTARTLLEEGDAMHVRNGRLHGATRRADAELREAVDAARNGDKAIGLTLMIDHTEPVRVVIRRLRPISADLIGTPRESVALYVSDPRKPIETSEEILQRLFGLTAREASVLGLLVEGADVQGVAARLGLGQQTVRTHLKNIMNATGMRRQTDLVRMVLASPAWIAGHRH